MARTRRVRPASARARQWPSPKPPPPIISCLSLNARRARRRRNRSRCSECRAAPEIYLNLDARRRLARGPFDARRQAPANTPYDRSRLLCIQVSNCLGRIQHAGHNGATLENLEIGGRTRCVSVSWTYPSSSFGRPCRAQRRARHYLCMCARPLYLSRHWTYLILTLLVTDPSRRAISSQRAHRAISFMSPPWAGLHPQALVFGARTSALAT